MQRTRTTIRPIVAFLVGNELSEASILATNRAHPGIRSYTGSYFVAENINASEAFIAEMADYLRTYEWQTYGRTSLISYGNERRSVDLIDTPFLDFRSQNAYPYAVPYFRPQTLPGSASGTLFQGWAEELKYMHPGVTIHEYSDAWWKFGLEDSLSQDPDDIEEWFGMVRLVPDGDGYATEPRPVYDQVRATWQP